MHHGGANRTEENSLSIELQTVYYVKGVNKGISNCQGSSSSKNQISVKDLTSGDLAKMIEKVKSIYNARVEPIQSTYFQHPCVQDEICSSPQEDISNVLKDQIALRKELLQQAALIGQMEKEKFLDCENSCFVELGAGKGKLSHWIRKACHQHPKNKFLLVERGSVRYKVDGHQKQDEGEDNFQRIKMDIGDLYLGKVPGLETSRNITVVGKHLCGGATDMGLRCAVNTLQFDPQKRLPGCVGASHPSSKDAANLTDNQKTLPELVVASHSSSKDTANLTDNQKTLSESGEINQSFTRDKANKTDRSGCATLSTVIPTSSNPILTSQTVLAKLRTGHIPTDEDQAWVKDTDKDKHPSNSRLEVPEEPPAKVQKIGEQSEGATRLPEGIMIALCCHHQCTWDTYVGQSFIEECGLSPAEFDLLTRLSSWATCARVRAKSNSRHSPGLEVDASASKTLGQTDTSEDPASSLQGEAKEEHLSEDLINLTKSSNQSLREQLSVSEREKIGRQCKRIIDTGRLHYIRSKGMKACLREYIGEETTPENVVLVAHL